MSPQTAAAMHAISLEISQVPKMTYLEDAASVPQLPEAPTVLALDFEIPGKPRRLPLEQLIDAVIALMRHRLEPWMIEAHGQKAFARAYLRMLNSVGHSERMPILVYLPEHFGKRSNLPNEFLVRTHAMLERLDPQVSRAPDAFAPATPLSPLEAARARRAQLLEQELWLDGRQVHQQQGGTANAPGANNTASRLRRKGELLGAWDGREYLHPAFQFDPKTGRLMPQMKELLAILPQDASGWHQVFWLFQPHTHLDGQRPADVFARDPDRVMEAAQGTFAAGDTNW